MKIKYFILPALLTIAVVVSFALSASILINPAHYDRSSQKVSTQSSQIDAKPMSTIYSPTQVIRTKDSGKQFVLTNQSVNLTTEIGQQMNNYKDPKFIELNSNEKNYLKYLNMDDSVMLNYPDSLNLRIVSQYISKSFKSLPNVSINRIVIPFDDSNDIYLFSDHNYKVYKIHVSDTNVKGIQKVIEDNVRAIPVKMKMINHTPFIDFYKSFTMPQYGYLINRTSQNYYVTRLLSDSQDISVKRHRNSTVYNDENSRQLSFSNDGEVNYYDSHPGNISTNKTQFLTDSYQNISQLLVSDTLANIRFFNYDSKNSKVVYRNYVEGFPIFDQTNYGAIEMRLVDNTSLKYNFSLNTLQIPVPTGRKDTKLITTDELLNSLRNHGYSSNKVTDIELAYQWSNTKSSNILITLQPTWFVKYNGKYMNYTQMLSKGPQ
ncbi:YycH family regulatory protein [Apilactobacillus kunkeei]|uniref:YycH family regulatory protein n=1 Tax=Apilactobacillus kunkeei TaxID=148814 RepID=UPI004034C177